MVSIDGVGRLVGSRVAGRRKLAGGAAFALPDEAAAAGTAGAAAAASPVSLASMLTLQEFGGETVEDREAKRHGGDLLAALAALQRALLGGGEESVALQRLAELSVVIPGATDRRLAALVGAINLRVRVELARRAL